MLMLRPRVADSEEAPALFVPIEEPAGTPATGGPSPEAVEVTEPATLMPEGTDPVVLNVCPQQYPVFPPHSSGNARRPVAWHVYPGEETAPEGDLLWKARYAVYQELTTYWSRTYISWDGVEVVSVEANPIALLHGRSDVLDNDALIVEIAPDYPEVPAILVAAAIAHQASDIERAFGVDLLEQIVLNVPGFDNMSIGIAQLRPSETESLGLGDVDLFEPEIAIRGMFSKITAGCARIDALQSPISPLPATDRLMLLSLAQNSPTAVDAFFAAGGDWPTVLSHANNQRVMRYFLVHLDWLLETGWELPGEIDLERWRATVFSAP
jgi:hypothetical protein